MYYYTICKWKINCDHIKCVTPFDQLLKHQLLRHQLLKHQLSAKDINWLKHQLSIAVFLNWGSAEPQGSPNMLEGFHRHPPRPIDLLVYLKYSNNLSLTSNEMKPVKKRLHRLLYYINVLGSYLEILSCAYCNQNCILLIYLVDV